jgi:hypothetical protein
MQYRSRAGACLCGEWIEPMPADDGNTPTEPKQNDSHPVTAHQSAGAETQRDRPVAVYGVLVLGVVTLLVLLGIIYFSSGDRDKPELPICTDITASAATQRVIAGEVKSLMVNYDDKGDPQSGERYGPVQARIEFTNGQCAYLPQGVTESASIYQMLGVIEFYNGTTEGSQIEVKTVRAENLPESLFETPTSTPTETPIPTETPVATETPEVTATPVPTRTPVVTPTPKVTQTPQSTATAGVVIGAGTPDDATPEASPAASPEATS